MENPAILACALLSVVATAGWHAPAVAAELEIYPRASITDTPAVAYGRHDDRFLVLGHSDGRLACRTVGVDNHGGAWALRPEVLDRSAATTYAVAQNWRNRVYLAVWSDGRTVAAARLDRRGQPIGSKRELYSVAESAAALDQVDVTFGASRRRWLVTWLEDGEVVARLVEPTGGPDGPPFTMARGVRRYAIGFAPAVDRFLLAWESDPSGGEPGVYAQLFKHTGVLLGSRMTIVRGRDHLQPAVGYDLKAKTWLVAWAEDAGGMGGVVHGRLIRNRRLLYAFRVHDSGTPLTSPAVSFARPQGMFLVAWTNAGVRARDARIEGRWIGPGGQRPHPVFGISSKRTYQETDNEEFIDCAFDKPTRCLVAWWRASTDALASIRGRVVEAPRQPSPPPPPPPAPTGPALEFRVDWNPGSRGRNVDLHVIEPTGEHIYFGNKVSQTGGRLGPECRCSPECGEETISWSGSATPDPGTYNYQIQLSNLCEGTTNGVRYRLQVWVDGRLARTTGWLDLFCDPARVPDCWSPVSLYRHP